MAIDKNADFTPSIPDSGVVPVKSPYNPTGSFKFWAQKVLPLVYDDSLSYYEVLCKVVNYLNNVIQNVDNLNDSVNSTNQSFETLKGYVNTTKDTLINTYNELQDYVNTYFDNLDVQEEINAKLDAMAESGELTNLLAPFIPDLVTHWLNDHVTPTSPIIDNTLSISGAGADAKVTGDKFTDLNEDLNDVNNIISKCDFFSNWTKGTYGASGSLSPSGNGCVSNITPIIDRYVFIKNGARATLFLYNNETYIGKINSSGGVDMIGGDWKYFTGIINVNDYSELATFNKIKICVMPTDDTTITDDNKDTWANNHAVVCIDNIKEIQGDLDDVHNIIFEYDFFANWTKGTYGASGSLTPSGNGCVSNITPIINRHVFIKNGARATLFLYNNETYIGKINSSGRVDTTGGDWKYFTGIININDYSELATFNQFRICVMPTDGTTITDDNKDTWANNHAVVCIDNIKEIQGDLEQKANKSPNFSHGTFNADGTAVSGNNGVVSSKIEASEFYLQGNCRCVVLLYSGDIYVGKINTTGGIDKASGSWKWFYPGTNDISTYLETADCDKFAVAILPTDGYIISADESQYWGNIHFALTSNNPISFDYANATYKKQTALSANNYVIGQDLLRKYVGLSALGTLKYGQSFCKYDGKYYSTDGSNIAEQDSTFTVIRDVPLNIGHGNTLQLGSNGKAYASGWNDNKIYVVDLAQLEIVKTITLPTTGYTCGVIDDVKNICYIFQRTSYPDHEDNYNFIAYDLTNEKVISTNITIPYGAMQACDLFNDRIIVLNGLGNSVCPNGYRVFDTSGNIIADYYLGDFSTQEPEGIFVDRNSWELLISFGNRTVYRISE